VRRAAGVHERQPGRGRGRLPPPRAHKPRPTAPRRTTRQEGGAAPRGNGPRGGDTNVGGGAIAAVPAAAHARTGRWRTGAAQRLPGAAPRATAEPRRRRLPRRRPPREGGDRRGCARCGKTSSSRAPGQAVRRGVGPRRVGVAKIKDRWFGDYRLLRVGSVSRTTSLTIWQTAREGSWRGVHMAWCSCGRAATARCVACGELVCALHAVDVEGDVQCAGCAAAPSLALSAQLSSVFLEVKATLVRAVKSRTAATDVHVGPVWINGRLRPAPASEAWRIFRHNTWSSDFNQYSSSTPRAVESWYILAVDGEIRSRDSTPVCAVEELTVDQVPPLVAARYWGGPASWGQTAAEILREREELRRERQQSVLDLLLAERSRWQGDDPVVRSRR